MIRTLRSEAIKITTTRTAVGFAAVAVLLTVAGTALLAELDEPELLEDKRGILAAAGTLSTILLVFGAVAAAGEFRHGTIASAFLAQPRRLVLTVARLLAYAATGLVVGVVVQLAAFAIGVPLLADTAGEDVGVGDLLELLGGSAVASALSAALGGALGGLMRSQIAAIVAIVAFSLIVEPTLTLASEDVVQYLPSTSLSAAGGNEFDDSQLAQGWAVLVALGWTMLFAGLAVVADQRRDV